MGTAILIISRLFCFGGVDTIYSHVPTLYPHCDNYLGTENVPGTDKKVSYYNILTTNTLLDGSLLGANRHGLIIHEFLHTLGYPDLYTRDGRSYPVYSWDIMAERSIYPAYPLAVLRETTGWAELPVIEEDTTLTLESPQTAVEGKPYAYAIKSPLNPYELFVVERREQGDAIDPDSLDAKIGGSGVIVYRCEHNGEGSEQLWEQAGHLCVPPQCGGYKRGCASGSVSEK